MIDLNTRLIGSTGWTILEASGISDQGVIAGTGMLNGQQQAVVLVPGLLPIPIGQTCGIVTAP